MKQIRSYPNFTYEQSQKPSYDLSKWVKTAKEIFVQEYHGETRDAAFNRMTSNWSPVEKLDFNYWLRFYNEGADHKYKTAQLKYYNSNDIGYVLPIRNEQSFSLPGQSVSLNPQREQTMMNEEKEQEKREIIEYQRSKILSRLNSLEKLLSSRDGQLFAGDEFEILMQALYELKKKFHMINKKSLSYRSYEDMIIRQANTLNKNGFTKSAAVFIRFAQGFPNPAEAPAPTQNVDTGGGAPAIPAIPGVGPSGQPVAGNGNLPDPMQLIQKEPNKDEPGPGMSDFLAKMNDGLFSSEEMVEEEKKDKLDVIDKDDFDIYVEAQAMPMQMPEQNLEINDPEIVAGKDFDKLLDGALQNVTVIDTINKLEEVAQIFKTREVPRQLAIVDIMLDKLGLAAFFPTLAEAMNKSLDANQYMSTRIDDIISRLRGQSDAKQVNLKGDGAISSPEIDGIKSKLQNEDAKEVARKQMRKKLQDQEMEQETKEEPAVDVSGLAPPVPPAPMSPLLPKPIPAPVGR